jgi:peptidoglycan/LPS O-acetylase OafA/YrhL
LKFLSRIKSGNEQFPALTGIRAIAAFMVFFHHLPLHIEPDVLTAWENSFYTGVTIFFVLSGFLITYRYYGRIELSGRYAWNYFINRFARIYPVYFLVLTIVLLGIKNFDFIFLLQNYTLTHNLTFIFPSHGMAIEPSWSLTVEECFYISAPFIFFLQRRYNIVIPFIIGLSVFILLSATNSDLLNSNVSTLFSTFFGNSIAFFCGIYLALFVLKQRTQVASKTNWRTIAGVAVIVMLSVPLIYATNKQEAIKHSFMAIFNNLLLPFPVALVFYGLIIENSWLKRFLSLTAMRLFGKSSYAFYLIHFPIIRYLADPLFKSYFTGHYNLYVIVVFVLTLVIAVFLFGLFEEPLNRIIRKKYTVATKSASPVLKEKIIAG